MAALWSISSSSLPFIVSPNSLATLLMLLRLMEPVLLSSKRSKILLIPVLDYLSPNFDVMASRNSSKSISLPSDSRSAIMLKIVGFLDSNPKLCMADFNSLGSIFPVAYVSKRLKASLNSSISSAVSPGLSVVFLPPLTADFVFPLIFKFKYYYCIYQRLNLKYLL